MYINDFIVVLFLLKYAECFNNNVVTTKSQGNSELSEDDINNIEVQIVTIRNCNFTNRSCKHDLLENEAHFCIFTNPSKNLKVVLSFFGGKFSGNYEKNNGMQIEFHKNKTVGLCDKLNKIITLSNNSIDSIVSKFKKLDFAINGSQESEQFKQQIFKKMQLFINFDDYNNCFLFNYFNNSSVNVTNNFDLKTIFNGEYNERSNKSFEKFMVCVKTNNNNNDFFKNKNSNNLPEQIYNLYREYFDSVYFIKNIGAAMYLSALFIIITAIIYCILPELRRNVYGKCVVFYLVSMAIAYASFGTRLTFSGQLGSLCYITGYLFHFAWIASFTWQSMMCFDIFLALSILRWPLGSAKGSESKKLFCYCLYGFGLPALLTIATAALQFGTLLEESSDWKPNIGGRYCFFQTTDTAGNRVRWLYFCGPFCIIIVFNVVMFLSTAVLIHKHSKSASAFKGNDSKRCSSINKRRNNELFQVHLNLFFVMGTNWILEVIVVIKDNAGVTSGWLFRLIDYFNTSVGIILFIVLVCKPKVLRSLKAITGKTIKKWPSTFSNKPSSTHIGQSSSCDTNLSSLGEDFINNKY